MTGVTVTVGWVSHLELSGSTAATFVVTVPSNSLDSGGTFLPDFRELLSELESDDEPELSEAEPSLLLDSLSELLSLPSLSILRSESPVVTSITVLFLHWLL